MTSNQLLDLCRHAGHEAGCEAAIHFEIYSHDDTEAILLVYATNAFNVINRQAALHNIRVLCETIYHG